MVDFPASYVSLPEGTAEDLRIIIYQMTMMSFVNELLLMEEFLHQ